LLVTAESAEGLEGGGEGAFSGLSSGDQAVLRSALPGATVGALLDLGVVRSSPPLKKGGLRGMGADPQGLLALGLVAVEGRLYDEADEGRRRAVCLLEERTREALFGSGAAVGARLLLEGDWYTLVGVVSQPAGTETPADTQPGTTAPELFIPLSTSLARLAGTSVQLSELRIALPPGGSAEQHAAVARRALARLHGADSGLRVSAQLTAETGTGIQGILAPALALLAGICLLQGAIAQGFALQLGTLERGIPGERLPTVRPALLSGALAGLAGCGAGWCLSVLFRSWADLRLAAPCSAALAALAASLLVALAAGLAARRAPCRGPMA